MLKIAPAFIAAKRQFAPLLKDKTNPAFRSKYADLGACIDAVEDALLANEIAVFHETSEDQSGITVECVLLHSSGEMIRGGKLHVPAAKQDPQGYGSALTYARRYSLTAVCGIAPEDDDGNAASSGSRGNSRPVAASSGGTISPTRIAYEGMTTDWKAWIDAWAIDVQNTFEQAGPAAAQELITLTMQREDLDGTYHAALYHKLDSKTRTALDKLTKSVERKAA